MTSADPDVRPGRQRLTILMAVLATVPGIVLRIMHLGDVAGAAPSLPYPVEALVFGAAIVGAAFLLSWAAETAQLDISAGLATAILALIAVLPEYAVDFVFAHQGGESFRVTGTQCLPLPGGGHESPCDLALANMTGANRLLIGVGWTMVVFIAFYRLRRTGAITRGTRWEGIRLQPTRAVELSYLALATVYSLTLPFKESVTLVDAAILVGIFVLYTVRVSRAPAEEPHLVGPALYVGTFSRARRRTAVIGMMLFAAGAILFCAEPFAHALVLSGSALGVREFLLVQWLAPLASEAPELLVAGVYAWRLNNDASLGTLVSAKVNQWTLLVGTLPIVFAVASRSTHGLPISDLQREELFLTAAQSFMAIAVLASLTMTLREAGLLFLLFWLQFVLGAVIPDSLQEVERVGVGIGYLLLGAVILFRERRLIPGLLRDGFRTPYSDLAARERP